MRLRESQRAWQARQSADLPPSVAGFLEEGHRDRFDPIGDRIPRAPESSSPWYVPNQWLVAVTRQLRKAKLWKAFNEEVIHAQAASFARLCGRMKEFGRRVEFARGSGVEPPELKGTLTESGLAARLADPLWWRRQFRKIWTRAAENGLRQLGLIRRDRQCYVSDSAVMFRACMRRRMQGFLRTHQLLSDQGELLELQEVAERSLSNPKLRVGELMCRLRGMEEYAQQRGHTWIMLTLTCPSAFHAQLSQGAENPRYNGSTVHQAQAWLCQMWARARARFDKHEVTVYGFRAAEPNHDATPHWHVLLFGTMQTLGLFEGIVRRVWLSEYESEPGAALHRVNCVRADPARGSAVGYLAKYIAKNVRGSPGQSGEDLEAGAPIHAGAVRAEDWSRIHGIRQFQQIGGPSVGLYRELRRIRNEDDIADPDLRACWRVADAGSYCGFISNLGGIEVGRRTNCRLEKVDQHRKNRYGEDQGPCVVGIRYASAVHITRTTEWKVIPCGTTLPCWAFSSWAPSSVTGSDTISDAKTSTGSSSATGAVPPSLPASRARTMRKRVDIDHVLAAWEHQKRRIEKKATERMFERLRSRSRSALGPVAITVTSTGNRTLEAQPETDSKSAPDTG